MKVITIGGATEDIFIQYAPAEHMHLHTKRTRQSYTLLGKGEKIEVDKITYATGGGATNSATSFSRLGFEVSSFFKIAHDDPGKRILTVLRQENVDTQLVVFNNDTTGTSFIIPCEEDRTIFAYRGANAHIKEHEVPYNAIQKANFLYITSLSGTSSQLLFPLCKFAKENGLKIANNPGKSQLMAGADVLRDALPYIDILILNAEEAQQLMLSLVKTSKEIQQFIKKVAPTKKLTRAPQLLQTAITIENICFNLQDFFNAIFKRGPHIVAVTNGAEGVYVATHEALLFHPSIKTKIINTIGAGDGFGSCFAASIFQGQDVKEALVRGIINATSVISYLNAKEGLLTKEHLDEQVNKIGLNQVQQFAIART